MAEITNTINSQNNIYQNNNLIQTNIPLKDKVWFKTGGAAKFFCQPTNIQEFQQAINFSKENNLEIFILGQGANILISDDGFDGLVIRPKIDFIEIEEQGGLTDGALAKTGAGVDFQELINYCLKNNIIGLEEFSGIPGTVGGSVFINIHYFEFLLSQFIVAAQVIDKRSGEILEVDKEWFNFSYNYSKLHENNYYLASCTFKLKKVSDLETAYARGRRDEIVRHRKQRYPNANTCGSFFRNFYPEEVTLESNGKKMIFVAYYLDKIGVKGVLSVGDAIVSYQHANMIVNRENATSADIVNLVRKMQELVKQNYGIIPQPECRLIGFKQYPLYK